MRVIVANVNLLLIFPSRSTYGMTVSQIYDQGNIFTPDVLDIDDKVLIDRFMSGITTIASISLALNYPTIVSIMHSLVNSYKNLLAVSIATDYTFDAAQKVKDYLENPEAFAAAAPAASSAPAADAAPAAKAEEKEEEKGALLRSSIFTSLQLTSAFAFCFRVTRSPLNGCRSYPVSSLAFHQPNRGVRRRHGLRSVRLNGWICVRLDPTLAVAHCKTSFVDVDSLVSPVLPLTLRCHVPCLTLSLSESDASR